MECPNCGEYVDDDEYVCPGCNKELPEEESDDYDEDEQN